MREGVAGTLPAARGPLFEDRQLSEDEVLKLEMQAWGLSVLLDVADEHFGRDHVDSWFEQWGLDVREIVAAGSWTSFEFAERLMDKVATAGGPELVVRAGRQAMSPRHLGAIYPLVRAFGSPRSTFERIARSGPRFNKVREIEYEELGPQRVRVCFHLAEGAAPPRTPHFCSFVRGQIEAVPMLFGLAPAQLVSETCMWRGDTSCDFEVQWSEPLRHRFPVLAALPIGAAVGAAIAALLGGGAALYVLLPSLVAATSWAGLLAWRQHGELIARIDHINEHGEALTESARHNERRYAELLQAKAEVDKKVEARTRELRETSERLAATLDEVRKLERAKTSFFSNVSHELRTPLTLLLAPLDDLANGREPPGGTQAALQSMHRNASRLRALINQLLDLAKADAGATVLNQVWTDLGQLVRDVTEGFDAAAKQRGVHLLVDTPDRMSPVAVDRHWLETAVSNLIANALRFVPRDGHITLSVRDEGAELRIAVSDDGPGIPAADQPTIFERFAQARDSQGGTGLGLALVREAARLHDGDVTLDSEPGKGTTFVITMPRALAGTNRQDEPVATDGEGFAVRQAAMELASEASSSGDGAADRVGPGPEAPTALVVEDNDDLRHFMADVLAVRYSVKLARSGREGLALARDLHPEVVVSDVRMADMDGLQLTRKLRADESTRGIPVLLVTALGELNQILEGFDAGASDYITKPFQGRELLARVDVHVRLRRMLHELAHQERLAMLGTVAASVAHEVRNPLTVLVSGLPAMKRRLNGLDPSSLEMLDVMTDCAERIETMTVDLLDLSRIDRDRSGRFQPGLGLKAAVRLTAARLPDAVELTSDVDEVCEIHGYPGDLNHVFLNMLDNAARAVGNQGRIRVEGIAEANAYAIRVADSGPGIDPAMRERILQPFVTTRMAGEGTGLGLSIARDVVDQHGGQLEVESAPEGGALFVIRLPRIESSTAELDTAAK